MNMRYHVTCPKTGQPIYFTHLTDLRAFVMDAMIKNKTCSKTIHVYDGQRTIGTMRKTPNGIVYRSSRTHKDRLLNRDGTFRS